MVPDLPATAEGELERTPFAHLAVYALERKLTGALFLTDPDAAVHTLRFARGVPVKVRPGDDHGLLGRLLVEGGHITEELLAGALEAKGRLGDVLVLSEKVAPQVIEQTVETQFRLRMKRLYALPPSTTYKYFDGHHELVDWGGEPPLIDPFELIWAGIEAHGDCSSMMEGTLEKLGESPVHLHPKHTSHRFNFQGEARHILELITLDPTPLAELLALEIASAETVRRTVYSLMLLRQVALGANVLPVDCEVASSPGVVGKVRLVTRALRVQAAAPDAPGDGERAPVVPRTRSKKASAAAPTATGPSAEVASSRAPEVSEGEAVPTSVPLEDELTPVSVTETRRIPVEPSTGASAHPPLDPPEPEASGYGADVRSGIQQVVRCPSTLPEGLGAPELFELSRARLGQRDFDGAVEAALASLAKDENAREVRAFSAFARSHIAGADLKALALELDELVQRDDRWVEPRFYRGTIRKKLGDDAGARRDFERVLAVTPDHQGARAQLDRTPAPPQELSLFGRLFRR